jgi:hypothetical protein
LNRDGLFSRVWIAERYRPLRNDKELAMELKDTVTELRQLVKDIKSDPKKYFKFSVF